MVDNDIMKNSSNHLCPCGSQLHFASCCQPLHKKNAVAMTPEKLMRSRYTAFIHKELEYLLFTHHKDYHQDNEAEELQAVFAAHTWLHLHVIKAHEDTIHQTGTVEFKACYLDKEGPNIVHACSNFIKENNQWYYTDDTFQYCK